MMFVGVDGCKKGWFAIKLTEEEEWASSVFENIDQLWAEFKRAAVILIDIPIGLREHGPEERECDVEARRFLGKGRASSVFRPPCRKAIYSPKGKASNINLKYTTKKLPIQTLSITPKIREVDALLCKGKSARRIIREIHPEICFWALANRHPMEYSKKKQDGFLERKSILEFVYPLTKNIVEHALTTYPRKDLANDDILDALAAAITAKLGFGRFSTIPEIPPTDLKGLRMEMVYFALRGVGKGSFWKI